MNGLKQWVLTVCIAAVICAIFELLIPDRKYEKLLRPVAAAFAVYAILSPLAGFARSCAGENISFPRGDIDSGLRETVDRQAAGIVRSALAAEIKNALSGTVPEGCIWKNNGKIVFKIR